jgi:hypothetical protein
MAFDPTTATLGAFDPSTATLHEDLTPDEIQQARTRSAPSTT